MIHSPCVYVMCVVIRTCDVAYNMWYVAYNMWHELSLSLQVQIHTKLASTTSETCLSSWTRTRSARPCTHTPPAPQTLGTLNSSSTQSPNVIISEHLRDSGLFWFSLRTLCFVCVHCVLCVSCLRPPLEIYSGGGAGRGCGVWSFAFFHASCLSLECSSCDYPL